MTAITRNLILGCILAMPFTKAAAQPTLTDINIFAANSSGQYTSGFAGDTRPEVSSFNVWIKSGASFLNGPSDAAVQPSISLLLGANTFRLYVEPGSDQPYYGINLCFGGSVSPAISAYAARLLAAGPHSFFANSASVTIGPTSEVPGSGTLSFTSGDRLITLTDFYEAGPTVFSENAVSPYSTDPNGSLDYVGSITLTVTAVPEPGMTIWVAGLLVTAVAGWRKTRKN